MSVNPGFALSSGGGTSAVYIDSTAGTLAVNVGKVADTVTVRLDPGYTLGNIGSVTSITNSIAVHIGSTGGTLITKLDESSVLAGIRSSIAVYFDRGNPSVNATFSGSISAVPETGVGDPLYNEAQNALVVMQKAGQTFAVYFDPASPAVSATFSGSIAAVPTTGSGDPIYEETGNWTRVLIAGSQTAASLTINGTLTGITNSVAVHVGSTGGTIWVKQDPDGTLGAIRTALPSGTNDLGNIIRVKNVVDGTLSTVTTVGAVTNITNSIAVHLLSTGGTLHVRLADNSAGLITDDTAFTPATDVGFPVMGLYDDTATDSVDEGDAGIMRMTANRIQMSHLDSTASLFTVSGSTSAVSTSGATLISPSANASFKIYAYSIQTTGAVSISAKFTNGSGASPTEFWRPLVTASGVTGVQGANLTSWPSAPLFVTGTSTTLSLVLDSATLVHYSVAYTKESA